MKTVAIGSRYQSSLAERKYDVIIIGSGVSGLTLAALQAKQGRSVLVLEKHYVIGGFTHTYQRGGYEWATGLHYMGDVHRKEHPLRIVFDFVSGGKLRWVNFPNEYDRLIFPDRSYSLREGTESFREEMLKHFPEEKKAIDAYLKLLPRMTEEVGRIGIGKLLPKPIREMIHNSGDAEFFRSSTWSILRSLTSNEKLIGVLTGQWGNYGLPPKKSSFGVHGVIAHHYLNGACFPEGGPSEVARTIVAEISKHDGKVAHSAEVAKVIIVNGEAIGIELASGDRIYGKKIVSSTGILNTYGKLIPTDDCPEVIRKECQRVVPSTSYLSVTIGAKRSSDLLNHAGGNLWIAPSYDHDKNYDSYLQDPKGNRPPMFYISFPSLKDPHWKERFGEKTAIDIFGVANYQWFKNWEATSSRKRGEDYQKKKMELVRPYFETLFQMFPGLQETVDFEEISSPLTVRHYANYQQGEIYGRELSPDRYQESGFGPRTPIKNFYLTGQDILVNGVCGALTAGLMTSLVLTPLDTVSQLLPLDVMGRKLRDI